MKSGKSKTSELLSSNPAGERMLGDVLDSINAHVAVIDHYGKITAVNEAWFDFQRRNGGAAATAAADNDDAKLGVGANYLEICERSAATAPEAKDVAAGIRSVLNRRAKNFTFEYPCHSSTEKRWFYMSVTPLRYDHGGAVITHTDITARRIAEEKLREEKHRYQILTEISPVAIYVNIDNKIAFANDACVGLFGADSLKNVIGKSVFEFISPDFVETIKRRIAEIRRTGKVAPPLELKIVRVDGSTIDVESTASAYIERGEPAILVALRDISEQKQIESQLRRNHETFFSLVQNAPFGIFIVDHNFHLNTISAGAKKVFAQIDPLIGRDFAEILRQIWEESLADEATERFRHTLLTGESYHSKDTTGHRNDRDDVESYDWKIERISLPDGNFGVVCYFYDLTERLMFEEALRESEEKLRLFVEHAPASVAMLDRNLRYLKVSRRWLEDYRIKDEIIGRSHYEVFPGNSEKWREISQKCLAGAVEKSEEDEFIRDDGTTVWLKWEARPWFDLQGKPSGIVIFTEDITERIEFENQLRLYEKVVVNARDAILITEAQPLDSPGPRIVYSNPAFTKMTGYKPEEVIGKTPRILNGEKTDRAQLDNIRDALKQWKPIRAELTNYRKNGTEFEVDFDIFPIADKTGWFTKWVSIHRDVSERKKLMRELSVSEEKYRLFFEKNPLPVAVIEEETFQVLEINEAAIRLYGYSREEFLSMSFYEIIPPEDLQKVLEIAEAKKNEDIVLSFPVRNRKKNGDIIDVEGSSYKIDFENRPARLVIIQDVTGRREAERLVREKNQLLEQTYDAIFIWNLKDGITHWNPNAERLYGYTESEAIGRKSYELLKTVYPQPYENFTEILGKKRIWEGELTHTTKNGEEVFVEARLHVLEQDAENLVILETLRDVTERRRLEAKLAYAAQLALIGELAAGLAHEIKNPLAGIKGVIDILRQRQSVNSNNKNDREILESVSREIERIDKTVRAMLHYSRPKPLEIRLAPLDETVRRAVKIAAHHANARKLRPDVINIDLEIPKDSFLIPHDSAKIEDAVLNLLLNAADAIDRQANGKIIVRLRKKESAAGVKEVQIEVTDNGGGIAPENLEKIFTPFHTSKDDGTGLGLTSVRRIARAHGGDCKVFTTIGKTSTFIIHLPLDSTANYKNFAI